MGSGQQRVRMGTTLLLLLWAAGTLYFLVISNYTFDEALYQTVTIFSTVGLTEVHPFGVDERIVSILLMIGGVVSIFYILGGAFEGIIDRQLNRIGRKRMARRIERLRNQVVVCGYGRVGSRIVAGVQGERPVVVIDAKEEAAAQAVEDGYSSVVGNATHDEVLLAAGIERAEIVIIALGTDADVISTVLSVRQFNTDCTVVARANQEESESKLSLAGVNHVVNPLLIGARRLAAFAVQPAVADFLDVVSHAEHGDVEYRLAEVSIPHQSSLDGMSLREAALRERTGALILAIRSVDGKFHSNPGADTTLTAGTTVIAIGRETQLRDLEIAAG